MVTADVKVQEIHHLTEPEPINEVAHGPAEYGGKAHGQEHKLPGHLVVKPQKGHGHHRGDKQKKELTHPGGLLGKHAKGPAGVEHMGDIKKRGHRNAVIKGQALQDHSLGDLIQHHHGPGNENKTHQGLFFHPCHG